MFVPIIPAYWISFNEVISISQLPSRIMNEDADGVTIFSLE